MTDRKAMQQALEALENNRKTHYYCDDTWYSCPQHEEGCANDSAGDECVCGADEANVEIDGAITALREVLAQPEQEPVDLSYQPDWKEEYQKAVDLHCLTLDELREKNVEIKRLKAMVESQDMVLVRSAERIVDLQTHIENLEGEDK